MRFVPFSACAVLRFACTALMTMPPLQERCASGFLFACGAFECRLALGLQLLPCQSAEGTPWASFYSICSVVLLQAMPEHESAQQAAMWEFRARLALHTHSGTAPRSAQSPRAQARHLLRASARHASTPYRTTHARVKMSRSSAQVRVAFHRWTGAGVALNDSGLCQLSPLRMCQFTFVFAHIQNHPFRAIWNGCTDVARRRFCIDARFLAWFWGHVKKRSMSLFTGCLGHEEQILYDYGNYRDKATTTFPWLL